MNHNILNINIEELMDAAQKVDVKVVKRVAPTEVSVERRLREIADSSAITITDEYKTAFRNIFLHLRNVLLTGGAGVGKTTFLKDIVIPELNLRGIKFAVTAMTGIAGSHLSGRTVHSWLGIGLGPEYPPGVSPLNLPRDEIETIYARTYARWCDKAESRSGQIDGVRRRLRSTEVLILDEVSMCHGVALLGYMDYFMRAIREVDKPFGDMQMIFAGDFCQLPPVEKFPGKRPDWAFLSSAWRDAEVYPTEFTEVFRQADHTFAAFLNRRRTGQEMTPEERAYAARFVRVPDPDEARKATFLMPTNKQADVVNTAVLQYYPEPEWKVDMQFDIRPHHLTNQYGGRTPDFAEIRRRLANSSILRETLTLRVGLPVLLTANDPGGAFVNGSKAFVKSYRPPAARNPLDRSGDEVFSDSDLLVVTLLNGTELILSRVRKCLNSHDDPEAMTKVGEGEDTKWLPKSPRLSQFPVIPGTALTVHRSQGMSLDDCVVDLNRSFAPGQVYVALSRLRRPEGLTLVTDKFEAMVDPHVLAYYAQLRKLQEQQRQAVERDLLDPPPV